MTTQAQAKKSLSPITIILWIIVFWQVLFGVGMQFFASYQINTVAGLIEAGEVISESDLSGLQAVATNPVPFRLVAAFIGLIGGTVFTGWTFVFLMLLSMEVSSSKEEEGAPEA